MIGRLPMVAQLSGVYEWKVTYEIGRSPMVAQLSGAYEWKVTDDSAAIENLLLKGQGTDGSAAIRGLRVEGHR